jgi:hypothetical protein
MGTIYSVNKMWSTEETDAKSDDSFRKVKLTFTDQYQVFASADTTLLEIYQAPGIPGIGSSHPDIPTVYCNGGTPKRISPILWHFPVKYEGEVSLTPTGPAPATQAKPTVDIGVRTTEMEVDEDYNGNPIQTANGEQVKVRKLFRERIITITRNMPFFNEYIMSDYDDATNSDTFFGHWPPGTVTVELTAQNVYDRDTGYWKVRGVFYCRRPYRTTAAKAWYSRWRHEGFYERVDNAGPGAAGNRIIRAVDGNKEPVTKPVLLDKDGYRISAGSSAHWIENQLYGSLPFNDIGLI